MNFMNTSDIEQAVHRYGTLGSRPHPVLGRATRLLAAVAEDAYMYSDGWHSWPVPCPNCKDTGQATPQPTEPQTVDVVRYAKTHGLSTEQARSILRATSQTTEGQGQPDRHENHHSGL